MHLNLGWHDYLILISVAASIAGLLLLYSGNKTQIDESEATQALLGMSFAYSLVYCVTVGIQKIWLPESEIIQSSLKITAAISYFLTFACILSLPLSRFAVRQIEE